MFGLTAVIYASIKHFTVSSKTYILHTSVMNNINKSIFSAKEPHGNGSEHISSFWIRMKFSVVKENIELQEKLHRSDAL